MRSQLQFLPSFGTRSTQNSIKTTINNVKRPESESRKVASRPYRKVAIHIIIDFVTLSDFVTKDRT